MPYCSVNKQELLFTGHVRVVERVSRTLAVCAAKSGGVCKGMGRTLV